MSDYMLVYRNLTGLISREDLTRWKMEVSKMKLQLRETSHGHVNTIDLKEDDIFITLRLYPEGLRYRLKIDYIKVAGKYTRLIASIDALIESARLSGEEYRTIRGETYRTVYFNGVSKDRANGSTSSTSLFDMYMRREIILGQITLTLDRFRDVRFDQQKESLKQHYVQTLRNLTAELAGINKFLI